MTHRTGSPGGPLGPDDKALSEALAHFAQGLIFESERGRGAPETLDQFLQAIAKDPEYHPTYSKAALAALYRRDIPKAIEILEESCRRNRRSAQSRIDLAVTYQITGKLDLAADSFARAIDLDPLQPFAYFALARLRFFKQQDSQAMRVLADGMRRCRSKDQIVSFCLNQARFFVEQQQGERAKPCLDMIMQSGAVPRDQVYGLQGEIFSGLGQTNAAVQAFESAIEASPDAPENHVRLALYILRSDADRAVRVLQAADARLPDSPAILLPLAFITSVQKRDAEALEIFDHVCALSDRNADAPLSAEAYLHFGSVADRSGLLEKAEAIFEQGLRLHPYADEIQNYLAYMWAERGIKLARGMDYVRQALQNEPDNGAYIDTLGWIQFKMGRFSEALDQIRRAADILKDDPTVLDHLGDVHQALGSADAAVEAWKRSYAVDPSNAKVAEKLRARGVDPASVKPVDPPPDPGPQP